MDAPTRKCTVGVKALVGAVAVPLILLAVTAGGAGAQDGPDSSGTLPSEHGWTLEKCIETALQNNHRRPASQFALRAAEAQSRQALAAYWPQISVMGGFQHLDESPDFVFPASSITVDLQGAAAPPSVTPESASHDLSGSGRPASTEPAAGGITFPIPRQDIQLMNPDSFVGSASLAWLLWDGGMRRGYREQAAGQLELVEQEARRTDLEIVDMIKRYYYGAVLARQLHELGTLTLERMQVTLDLTETMYKEGSGTVKKTDFLENKVMVESIRSMVAVLEKNEAMAQAALAYGMGLSWDASVVPAATEIPFEPVDLDPERVVGAAYEFSPDWAELQAGLRALKGGVKTAKSDYLPKIALTGDLHKWWNDLGSGMATDTNKEGWSVGIMMQVSIFDGFLTRNRVAEAEARRSETEQKGFLLKEGIGLKVKSILLDLDATQKQYQATRDALEAAEENRDLNTRAYQNELVETGDVIRAQLVEALTAAQHDKTRYDHLVLRSRLDLVVGTKVAELLREEP